MNKDMLVKLLLLQVIIADQRLQYAIIGTNDMYEKAFADGVIAACEFFEEALEHIME